MVKKTMVVFFLCFLLLSSGVPVFGKTVCMTSCDWAPYAAENLLDYGFTARIIQAAFKRAGHDVVFQFVPWRRAMKITEEGKCEGLFSAYYSDERAKKFAVSNPYAKSGLYFCKLRKTKIKPYHSLKDLSSYRIGVVAGYVNTPEFDQAQFLKKDPAASDLVNLKKLKKGRIDLIVIDKYVALYHLKNSPTLEMSVNDIEFLEPPLKEQPIHIMFSKGVKGYEQLMEDFNRGLSEITEDGTIEKIMEKYGF